jgi:allene oxide cyclase-like protein
MLKRAVALLALAAFVVPGAAQAETLTIQVTSVVVKFTSLDRNPKGTSAGDRVVQRNKLLNTVRQFGKVKGTHVGSDEGTITFTSAHSERYDGVARLPGGMLKVKGVVRLLVGGGIRIPVVGGTGRYKGATGMLYVGEGENRALNVYRITLPGNVA